MYAGKKDGSKNQELKKNFGNYLIVTIICEYKILRFGEWDDYAGTNFCDFMKSSKILRFRATKGKKLNFEIHWL